MLAAHACHAGVMAAVHRAAYAQGEAWDEAAFAVLLTSPGVFGFVAGAGGVVLARVAADEAEILTLAVAPERRRLGLGRALLAAARAEAVRHGAVCLFLEVAEANVAARALYQSAGFAQVGTRRAYYADGGDALVLRGQGASERAA